MKKNSYHYKKELGMSIDKRDRREQKRFEKLQKRLAKKDEKYLNKIMKDFAGGKDEWLGS